MVNRDAKNSYGKPISAVFILLAFWFVIWLAWGRYHPKSFPVDPIMVAVVGVGLVLVAAVWHLLFGTGRVRVAAAFVIAVGGLSAWAIVHYITAPYLAEQAAILAIRHRGVYLETFEVPEPWWRRIWLSEGQLQHAVAVGMSAETSFDPPQFPHDGIDDELMKHIQFLRYLELLDISSSSVSDAGMQHITGLRQLSGLYVSDTALTDDGVAVICQIESLERLALRRVPVSDAGIARLKHLPRLERLSVGSPSLTYAGFASLAEIVTLSGLEVYQFAGRFHGDAVPAPGLSQLESLSIFGPGVDGRTIEFISNGNWPKLTFLQLVGPDLRTDNLDRLASLANLDDLSLDTKQQIEPDIGTLRSLPRLKNLRLWCAKISPQATLEISRLNLNLLWLVADVPIGYAEYRLLRDSIDGDLTLKLRVYDGDEVYAVPMERPEWFNDAIPDDDQSPEQTLL